MKRFVLTLVALFGLTTMAHADISSVLQTVCSNVDCLNNFTAKTGWSFSQHQEYSGGYTDFETSWYLSPSIGFDVPIGAGLSVGTPLIDPNAVFKLGKLLSDKVPAVHSLVNSDPFVSGLLGKLVIGETVAYDATANNGKWFDITWLGANVKF